MTARRMVDRCAGARTLLGRNLAQTLQELGQRSRLAEEARLHLFQLGGAIHDCKGGGRVRYDLF